MRDIKPIITVYLASKNHAVLDEHSVWRDKNGCFYRYEDMSYDYIIKCLGLLWRRMSTPTLASVVDAAAFLRGDMALWAIESAALSAEWDEDEYVATVHDLLELAAVRNFCTVLTQRGIDPKVVLYEITGEWC